MTEKLIWLSAGNREFRAAVTKNAGGETQIALDGGEPYVVEPIDSDTYRVTRGGQAWRAVAVAEGNRRWVFLDGKVVIIDVQDANARRRRKSTAGAQSLSAPMPATVTKVMVSANQPVKKGDTLIVLEAMKMELPIRAPADGIVKNLHCKEGELVQPDTALVDFE